MSLFMDVVNGMTAGQAMAEEIERQRVRIAELEAVLREVAHGELLDGVGNRNDNGLQDFQNWPAGGKQITTWLRKIETVLEPK